MQWKDALRHEKRELRKEDANERQNAYRGVDLFSAKQN